MEQITPKALVESGGDGRAAEALRVYIARGLGKALSAHRLREEDIDDFTQAALIRIFEKIDTFRGDSRFTTWAMAVAIRVSLGALRTRRYRERLVDNDFDVMELGSVQRRAWEDPTRPLERSRLRAVLFAAIAEQLTERQRIAVLGELEGVPTAELAERLGISPNALYKLHHDARVKLRRAIQDAGVSEEEVRRELQLESEEA